jgi:diguanylate cyclase (GGDEF)-like protein
MRPVKNLKSALFRSLYRSSFISTAFAVLVILLLIFLSIEKDLRQEGQYLGQLVFKELRGAMNRGASYEEVNTLISELNRDAPGITYSMYRSEAIEEQFGKGRNLTPAIKENLADKDDATKIESIEKIHYYRTIKFENECLQCHQNVTVGETAGVLDVTFSADLIRIPISEVLLGLFLVFSVTMITSYLTLSRDLLSHMITPLQRLGRKLKETEGHHDLNERLDLDSDLKEILTIEHAFNAQQELLHIAFQKVEEVSIYDKLTSTYNRHQLERLFAEETLRSSRQTKPLTIALLDLNGFKQINDSYGHQAGDEILIHFCKVFSDNLRITDKIIRYGGDEFIVLLPDCNIAAAQALFTRIESCIASSPYHFKGQALQTRFSTGFAEYPKESSTEAGLDLIQTADERMYKDKQKRKATQ